MEVFRIWGLCVPVMTACCAEAKIRCQIPVVPRKQADAQTLPFREGLWCFLDVLPTLLMLIVAFGGVVAGIVPAPEAAGLAAP